MKYDSGQMRMRWVIVGLLFFATTINYLDRAILGVILPEIRDKFHFGLQAYGLIQMFFQLAYAGGSLLGGYLLDRLGTRIGYGIAATVWFLAATLNAFAGSVLQFGVYPDRAGLRRIRQFSRLQQGRRGMVPSRRTRHGHGNRERGHKPGQYFRAAAIHLDCVDAGMAGVLRHHGRARISLAAVLVPDLSPAKASRRANDAGRKDFPSAR